MSEIPVVADEDAVIPQMQKQPVSLGFQLLLSLANTVIWLAIIPVQQFLLPLQAAGIDPVNKVSTLSFVLLMTGITGVLAQPIVGALSDRTATRFGRRRTWMAVGLVLTVLTIVLLANANTVVVLAIEAAIYGFVMGMILSPVLAIIPDRVPVSQRATTSAFVGLAQPLGILIGSILIAQVLRTVQGSYYAIAAILFVVIALFLVLFREIPIAKEDVPPFVLRDFLVNFFSPLRSADYRYTWIARFLVILAQTILVEFMLYFLNDVIHYQRLFPGQSTTQGVAIFQVINTVTLIIATIVSGIISDRLQRRKPFIIVASIVMAVALLLLAFVPSWPTVIAVAIIFGIGFGTFLSSDIALSTQVLPEAQNQGRDLGLITSANVLPEILFPLISFLAFGVFHGYTALFSIAAVAAVLGALCIVPIKGVR
ncbi:MAG TPA: MFS transporter [Ktedonobacteraceae bacterium]|nr:MFS transporter [Ktedonobacteraceae bacterium]